MLIAVLLAATASAFDQVIAAERAFAAAALERGTHAAFVAFLAPDAIEFGPTPRPARPSHENKARTKSTLTWGPAWVAVSAAGDLALSSGPFEFRPNEPGIIGVTPGLFMTVWRRQPDGSWKVAVDSGIGSPIKFAMPLSVENGSAAAAKAVSKPSNSADGRLAITAAERTFAVDAKTDLGDAIAKRAANEVRVYREGKPAGLGLKDARALLLADKRRLDCKPDQIIASESGDMGYAYGTCNGESDGKPKGFGFLHVWRKQPDGSWRILVDVTP